MLKIAIKLICETIIKQLVACYTTWHVILCIAYMNCMDFIGM